MPEDYTDLLPEDNGVVTSNTVDSIHNTMDTVIKMYKRISDGLNDNSKVVNEFLEDLEKKKDNNIKAPSLPSLEDAIAQYSNLID